MNYATSSNRDSELPVIAGKTLIYVAVSIGALSFWAEAFAMGDPLGFVVAAMLSAILWACSTFLSGAAERFMEARKRAPWTAGLVVLLALGLILLEAGMTHHGLIWVDQRYDLGSWEALMVAAVCLSLLNLFALFVFARDLPTISQERARAHDDVLGKPGDYANLDDRMNNWERRIRMDTERPKTDPKITDIIGQVRAQMGG